MRATCRGAGATTSIFVDTGRRSLSLGRGLVCSRKPKDSGARLLDFEFFALRPHDVVAQVR